MTYVVSDLHGCLSKFQKLLDRISFRDSDVLYVLGDSVDYGDQSMALLYEMSIRPNILPIAGEHDFKAARILSAFDKMMKEGKTNPDKRFIAAMTAWVQDGGQPTFDGFRALDNEMKEGILDYLEEMPLYEDLEVNGQEYILTHAGITHYESDRDLDDYRAIEFFTDTDPEAKYAGSAVMVMGHKPTYTIEGATAGKIYRSKSGNILLDCGAAFDEKLGCLCLETGDEVYI